MARLSALLGGAILAAGGGSAAAEECSTYDYFVMGYGSLMKESSRMKTSCKITSLTASHIEGIIDMVGTEGLDPEVAACVKLTASQKMMPVLVKGARRGWYSAGNLAVSNPPEGWTQQALDLAPTYLGAVEDPDSLMYAVIYPVTEDQLKATDEREASATYTPGWIKSTDATLLNPNDKFSACPKIRWYPQSPEQVTVPTTQKPICQSYVDLFLGGVMDLATKNDLPNYTIDVLNTTYGWSKYWVNDRAIDYRPFAQEKDAFAITKALGTVAKAAEPEPTSTVELPAGSLTPLSIDIMEAITYPGQLPVGTDSAATAPTDEKMENANEEEDEYQRLFLIPSGNGLTKSQQGPMQFVLAGVGVIGLAAVAFARLSGRPSTNQAHDLIQVE